jgi:ATP-dependent Clp protease ATP-binding subunit ClpC
MDPLLEKKAERARARSSKRLAEEAEAESPERHMQEFLLDMTAEAEAGRYHPVIGREREMEELLEVLCCRNKNNPLLLGDSGVGKTALVEDLALRMVQGRVPERLLGRRLFQLNVANLLAGAKYRGQFEERMLELLAELRGESCLVFLDNIQTLVGSGLTRGGSMDTASLLRPALLRGDIQAVGATSFEEFHNGIEREPSFARCFQPIKLEEADLETTGKILLDAKGRFESFHGVRFEEAGLLATVETVKRCLRDGRLPDTALDVMDLAAARVALAVAEGERADPLVREEDLLGAISHRSGVPLERLSEPQRDSLVAVESLLGRRVVGQEPALCQIAPVVRSTRQGIKLQPSRPNGVFLFVGPSGVGKTEMAKALAEFLFGDEEKLIRIDMSEYVERINATRLIGAAPGYVGYNDPNQLTDRLRRDPYSVVLLDEIEKADSQTLNLFLQVFDAGRLTDGRGRTVSFSHATVVMTSNVGTELYGRPRAGYHEGRPAGEGAAVSESALMREVRRRFPPEFLNRIDEIVFFEPLGHEAICRIARLQLAPLLSSLAERGKELVVSDEALDRLAEEGYSFEFGARNLGRIIRKRVLDPLALVALSPGWEATRRIELHREGDELVFRLGEGADEDAPALLPLESDEEPLPAEPSEEA